VCARNRERVTGIAHRFAIPAVYTDYRELIAHPTIDAVTVATPDALHFPVAMAALEAGKHVFCEKPLALTVDEALQLTERAESSGLVAMVAFTYRYTHALRELRRLIRAGAIGTPFYASAEIHWGGIGFPGSHLSWRERSAESAAGIWADGASHLFDALAFTLAPVQAVCAQMMVMLREPGESQPDSIDLATCLARLDLPKGGPGGHERGAVHATLLTSRVDQPRLGGDSMTVVGTRGALDIALTRGQHERAHLLRQGEEGWTDIPLPEAARTDRPLALTRMMGAFVEATLRGHPDPDDPTFRDGLHTQEAIEAALRSVTSQRWERVGSR
jgi:predicted dehydrogenase